MIRLGSNLLGFLALAGALILAVIDIARSIADDGIRLAPLGKALAALAPSASAPGGILGDLWANAASLPGSLLLGTIALLFLTAGRPSRRRRYRRAR